MKRNLTIALMAVFCLISGYKANAQELSRKEAEALRFSTDKMEVDAYENLIMFVLLKDTTYYTKGIELFTKQKETLTYLKNLGVGDEFFKLSVEMGESVADGNLTVYNNNYFLKNPVMNDQATADKKVKFQEKEYQVSKTGKKKFDELFEQYEKQRLRYEKLAKIKAEQAAKK